MIFGLIGVGLVLVLAGWLFTSSGDTHAADHAVLESAPSSIQPVSDTHGEDDHGHGHHVPTIGTRMLTGTLISVLFFFTISMGALFFLAVLQIGNGGWQTAIRRVPEAMSIFVPVAGVTFLILLFFLGDLYEWAILPAGVDELIDKKRGWLNETGFWVRTMIYFLVWIGAALWLRRVSIAQDSAPTVEAGVPFFRKSTGIAAGFVVFFAFSYSLFSFDWIKSLEPHWFSTIFGVYVFAGSFGSAMFTLGLLLTFLKRQGYMSYVNDSHIHDVYKFAFGFTVFWAYIWVSQYLLIWYANIPEEGIYYVKRYVVGAPEYVGGPFNVIWIVNLLLCFVAPFFGLMTRNSKRMARVYVPVSVVALTGHYLDLFQMITPGAMGKYWNFGLIEIGFFLMFAGIFLFVVFTALTRANLVPLKHPYLEESLHHTTGAV
ncbi:MAG: quinol:cytochrome C oxidoreductase [Chloroflexi bacterium AL-W]|nr:quinol:cytochrome C oxidoreductase [Chloroflexi bacterium AL-W]